MYGLLLIPMLVGAGIGLDMMRSTMTSASLTEAADAAVLAAARAKMKTPSLTDAQVGAIARKYFDDNRDQTADLQITSFNFVYDNVAKTFTVTTVGRLRTAVLGVVGRDYSDLNILSQAKVAPPRILEAVLALDTTGSMAGTRIDTLKQAAKDLVESIQSDPAAGVKVGVVPFSRYVNVGVANRNEPWITVPADYSNSGTSCWDTYPDRVDTNCTTTTTTCTSNNDGVISTYPCDQTTCDTVWGDPVQVCSPYTNNYIWRGCVGSRNAPFDVKDINFVANRVPGLLDDQCAPYNTPVEILPLTTDKASVIAKIDSLTAQGETYIPAGLMWGLSVLSEDAPFTGGASYATVQAQQGVKALILMTDGANTASSTYPLHNGSSASDANDNVEALCDEIKHERIEVYTIAFEVTDMAIKNLLEDCATTPTKYFDATNAAELTDAFDYIAENLQELALTQ
jgi:Mg-chelatase subunit ChlD